MTITKRTIRYARRYPGQSATQIANALRQKASTVSSILYKAVQKGELKRSEARWSEKGNFWNVIDGGGPAGGHVYGPAKHVCVRCGSGVGVFRPNYLCPACSND